MKIVTDLRLYALVLASFLLSGCAGIVYKDATSKYTDAAGKLIVKIHEAENLTAKALEAEKRAQAAQDETCPVAVMNVYLRGPVDRGRKAVDGMLERYPSLKAEPVCRTLASCRGAAAGSSCSGACLSRNEASCLDQLTHAWTTAAKAKAKADEEAAAKAKEQAAAQAPASGAKKEEKKDDVVEAFRQMVDGARLGSNRLVAPRIIAESLQSFAAYLDLLDEYADKNDSALKERSTKFANRIKERSEFIEKITGSEVLSATEIASQQKYVLAFGKLANTLQTLAKQNNDANKIKEIVRTNQAEVSATISLLRDYAGTVSNIGFVKTTLYTMERRDAIQEAYTKEARAEERLKMFELLDKLPIITDAVGMDELFDAFQKSHEALANLIQNPTDADLKKLRAQRFEEFRNVVTDLASVVKLFI